MENKTYIYRTIRSASQGLYKEKGSRFLAFAFPVSDKEEIKTIIAGIRKEHHEARHHCYAWVLGADRANWRANDDGEPSGTGGKPILGQINSSELTNILIVVTRYFGGTLLGTSGLINAYRTAAADAIRNSEIVELELLQYYSLIFPYEAMNDVMKVLRDERAGQSDQRFGTECTMTIRVSKASEEKMLARFMRIEGLTFRFIETR